MTERVVPDLAFMATFILVAAILARATGVSFNLVFAGMLLAWLPVPLWRMAKRRSR